MIRGKIFALQGKRQLDPHLLNIDNLAEALISNTFYL
ncbi:hypothetical protein Ga0451573_003763, partial [Peptococcaceae bacterium DYL19]|nr:hypothetical protein [Phosphitispora fastidiosa]